MKWTKDDLSGQVNPPQFLFNLCNVGRARQDSATHVQWAKCTIKTGSRFVSMHNEHPEAMTLDYS